MMLKSKCWCSERTKCSVCTVCLGPVSPVSSISHAVLETLTIPTSAPLQLKFCEAKSKSRAKLPSDQDDQRSGQEVKESDMKFILRSSVRKVPPVVPPVVPVVPQEIRDLPRKWRILPEQLPQRPGRSTLFYCSILLISHPLQTCTLKLHEIALVIPCSPSTFPSINRFWIQNVQLNWRRCWSLDLIGWAPTTFFRDFLLGPLHTLEKPDAGLLTQSVYANNAR